MSRRHECKVPQIHKVEGQESPCINLEFNFGYNLCTLSLWATHFFHYMQVQYTIQKLWIRAVQLNNSTVKNVTESLPSMHVCASLKLTSGNSHVQEKSLASTDRAVILACWPQAATCQLGLPEFLVYPQHMCGLKPAELPWNWIKLSIPINSINTRSPRTNDICKAWFIYQIQVHKIICVEPSWPCRWHHILWEVVWNGKVHMFYGLALYKMTSKSNVIRSVFHITGCTNEWNKTKPIVMLLRVCICTSTTGCGQFVYIQTYYVTRGTVRNSSYLLSPWIYQFNAT